MTKKNKRQPDFKYSPVTRLKRFLFCKAARKTLLMTLGCPAVSKRLLRVPQRLYSLRTKRSASIKGMNMLC